jgi:hypothetical protein
MTHLITPPPELRSKWFNEAPKTDLYDYIIEQAAQWGADQELEACCEWLDWQKLAKHENLIAYLRAARRPKSPSLKEQALEALDEEQAELSIQNYKLIRAVLEALPND